MKKIVILLMATLLTHSLVEARASQALSQLLFEIRNPETGSYHFRGALESLGEYLALEVLEELQTKESSVTTMTGAKATHTVLDETPVLMTILRAGLPLNAGIHKVFPRSEVGFFAMSRDEATLKAKLEYVSLPAIKGKTIILSDTAVATAGSILDAVRIIEAHHPKRIIIVAAVASSLGIETIAAHNPSIKVFAGSIDPTLNDKGYIVPGLGDAGDRSYGKKAFTTSDYLIPENSYN